MIQLYCVLKVLSVFSIFLLLCSSLFRPTCLYHIHYTALSLSLSHFNPVFLKLTVCVRLCSWSEEQLVGDSDSPLFFFFFSKKRSGFYFAMADIVGPRLYSCCNCRNHVSLHDDVISKSFQGKNGRAFLFAHAMNVVTGPKEDRHLLTGLHTVADVYCIDCREVLGWKYERAYDESQKYKEGKYILEKSKIIKENW